MFSHVFPVKFQWFPLNLPGNFSGCRRCMRSLFHHVPVGSSQVVGQNPTISWDKLGRIESRKIRERDGVVMANM
jgi:hypothetical protein